jgi:hypothetical protein
MDSRKKRAGCTDGARISEAAAIEYARKAALAKKAEQEALPEPVAHKDPEIALAAPTPHASGRKSPQPHLSLGFLSGNASEGVRKISTVEESPRITLEKNPANKF